MIGNVKVIRLNGRTPIFAQYENVLRHNSNKCWDAIRDNVIKVRPKELSMEVYGISHVGKSKFIEIDSDIEEVEIDLDDGNNYMVYQETKYDDNNYMCTGMKFLGVVKSVEECAKFIGNKDDRVGFLTYVFSSYEHKKDIYTNNPDVDLVKVYMNEFLNDFDKLVEEKLVDVDKVVKSVDKINEYIQKIPKSCIKGEAYTTVGLPITEQSVIMRVMDELELEWNNWKVAQKIFIILTTLKMKIASAKFTLSSDNVTRVLTAYLEAGLEEVDDSDLSKSIVPNDVYDDYDIHRLCNGFNTYLSDFNTLMTGYRRDKFRFSGIHTMFVDGVEISGYKKPADLTNILVDDNYVERLWVGCYDCEAETDVNMWNPYYTASNVLFKTYLSSLRFKFNVSDEDLRLFNEFSQRIKAIPEDSNAMVTVRSNLMLISGDKRSSYDVIDQIGSLANRDDLTIDELSGYYDGSGQIRGVADFRKMVELWKQIKDFIGDDK